MKEKKGILALDKHQADNFVSMDESVASTPVLLLTGYGWQGDNSQLHGGSIFNNVTTGAIWVQNQVLLVMMKLI